MRYDDQADLWVNSKNEIYIKNEFDINNPNFIEVSTLHWVGYWKGQKHEINWNDISLPFDIKINLIKYVEQKLKSSKVGITYISEIDILMRRLSIYWPSDSVNFNLFGLKEFTYIWKKITSHNRSTFREIIKDLSYIHNNLIDPSLVSKIDGWKARSNVKTLRNVLNWHPLLGSLTSSELALLKSKVLKAPKNESFEDNAIRLLIWTLIEVAKRSTQLLSLNFDSIKIITNNQIQEYFLEIPKSKYQTASKAELWPVSSELAIELILFRDRFELYTLRKELNRLFVWDVSTEFAEQTSVIYASGNIKSYVKKLKIISPRTKEYLHVTPNRLRHTVATRMAASGVSRDSISYILEHDSNESAQAYIDAIGSDLVPEIEKVDRNLGGLFKELNHIFFNGKISDELGSNKIFIPIFNANPLPVGTCGKDTLKTGTCKKQPFTACYNGCPSFLAWRDADHTKSLKYVENEFERWNAAEGNNKRSKAIKDFEQIYHSINEVINQIQECKDNAST